VKQATDARPVELTVWRQVPKKVSAPQRLHALPLERIDPLIRVAHRRGGGHLNIPERVIVDHEILLILSGKGDLHFRDGSLPFGSHDVLFLRPFVPHVLAGKGDVDHIAVHFDFSPRSGTEVDLDRRRPYTIELAGGISLPTKQRVAPHGAVERSLSLVVDFFELGTPEGKLRARGEILCALSSLLSSQARPRGELGRRRAQLERATAVMKERLAEPVSNRDLQRATGIGSSQLHALFRELTGYSPMEYLRRLRVEHARELLADDALSIKEVAARAGFSDPNHFSRVFARLDGVPPTAYRTLMTGKLSRRS
jgi:AraC-like DNA-binding protein